VNEHAAEEDEKEGAQRMRQTRKRMKKKRRT
jgi:hypothetical protein